MERQEYEALARVEAEHPWFVCRRRLIDGLARRFYRPWPPEVVLDAGCGTGTNLALWAGWGTRLLIGLDLHRGALQYCQARVPPAALVQADLTSLPLDDKSVDLVVSSDVIEHVGRDSRAVSEMARVLRPGGVLLLTTPACSWAYTDHDRHLHHVRRYDSDRLSRLLAHAGLEVLHWSRYNVLVALPLWVYRRWLAKGDQSDVGRPLPRALRSVLAVLWEGEQRLAQRMALPFGFTHVVVARRLPSQSRSLR